AFTPEGGTVLVGLTSDDNEARFLVRDTGPGISADEIPHIFDRYWRGSRPRYGGLGLGLAISKGIVEGHDGRIWVESRPGKGATFQFALPLVDSERSSAVG